MNQKKLGEALSGVVEDCVNKVGVDLNTASASLLEYISGISKAIAKNIVAYREENGRFESRRELLKVAKLGPKAFEPVSYTHLDVYKRQGQEHRPPQRTLHRRRKEILPRKPLCSG